MAQSHNPRILNAPINHVIEGLNIILCPLCLTTILMCNGRPRSSFTNAEVGCSVSTHYQGRLELTGCAGAGFCPWTFCLTIRVFTAAALLHGFCPCLCTLLLSSFVLLCNRCHYVWTFFAMWALLGHAVFAIWQMWSVCFYLHMTVQP